MAVGASALAARMLPGIWLWPPLAKEVALFRNSYAAFAASSVLKDAPGIAPIGEFGGFGNANNTCGVFPVVHVAPLAVIASGKVVLLPGLVAGGSWLPVQPGVSRTMHVVGELELWRTAVDLLGRLVWSWWLVQSLSAWLEWPLCVLESIDSSDLLPSINMVLVQSCVRSWGLMPGRLGVLGLG